MELTRGQVEALKALYNRTVDVGRESSATMADTSATSKEHARAATKLNESWGIVYGIEETLARIGLEVERDGSGRMVGVAHGYRKVIDGQEVFSD